MSVTFQVGTGCLHVWLACCCGGSLGQAAFTFGSPAAAVGLRKASGGGTVVAQQGPEELLMGLQAPQMPNCRVFFAEILTVQQKAGDTATQVKDVKHLLPAWVVQQRAATQLPCPGEKAGPNVWSSF